MKILKGTHDQLKAAQKFDDDLCNLPGPPSKYKNGKLTNFCPDCDSTAVEKHPTKKWHCKDCGWFSDKGGKGCTMHVSDINEEDGSYCCTEELVTKIAEAKSKAKSKRDEKEKVLAELPEPVEVE